MKKQEIKTYTPFIVPIQSNLIEDKKLNKKLFDFSQAIKKNKGRQVSNVGGFQSQQLSINAQPFINFFDVIRPYLNLYVDIFEMQSQYVVEPDSVWLNINKKNDFNRLHNHAGGVLPCDFCGVYYIKAEKNQGHIQFINPNTFTEHTPMFNRGIKSNKNCFNFHTFDVLPETGNLILFPNNLPHCVFPNKTNKERISLAFNLRIKWF